MSTSSYHFRSRYFYGNSISFNLFHATYLLLYPLKTCHLSLTIPHENMPLVSYYTPWKHATCLLLYPLKTCHLSLIIPPENMPLVSYYTPWKHATCLLLYPLKTCHLSLTIPTENMPLVSYYTPWKQRKLEMRKWHEIS